VRNLGSWPVEEAHAKGEDGLQRAKQWLDLTSRVKGSWTQTDRPMSELLHFQWPYAPKRPFSFDLGGNFRGDDLEDQSFVAEVKNYQRENDLPTQYRDFLAKCYVALESKPDRCDHFLWISWSPFQARSWDKHATSNAVRSSVIPWLPGDCLCLVSPAAFLADLVTACACAVGVRSSSAWWLPVRGAFCAA
jgi:hypothetical protein